MMEIIAVGSVIIVGSVLIYLRKKNKEIRIEILERYQKENEELREEIYNLYKTPGGMIT